MLYSDEFLASLPSNPIAGALMAIEIVVKSLSENEQSWIEKDYQNLSEALLLFSEMKAANIPLSAFEENRRDVDKDPAAYLKKNPSPQDAEDYFLVGRAYLLTGDFAKARIAFVEARNRIGEADPTNANVLRNDIGMAIAVTNDTTIQNILKKELEAPKTAANSNTNTNANK